MDFEAAAVGPREWDLLPTAVAVERYGLAEERYREFAAPTGSTCAPGPATRCCGRSGS